MLRTKRDVRVCRAELAEARSLEDKQTPLTKWKMKLESSPNQRQKAGLWDESDHSAGTETHVHTLLYYYKSPHTPHTRTHTCAPMELAEHMQTPAYLHYSLS